MLAQRHDMDLADAEAFVNTLLTLIEEALFADKYVKVKGLGTFKLIEDSRKSRISFTPDPWMRDTVNKPFEHFETVLLNENTQFDDLETGEEEAEDWEKDSEPVASEDEKEEKTNQPEQVEQQPEENKVEVVPAISEPAVEEIAEPSSEQDNLQEMNSGKRIKILHMPWCMIASVLLVGILIGGGIIWSILSGRRYIPESVMKVILEQTSQAEKPNSQIIQIQDSVRIMAPEVQPVRQDTVHENVPKQNTPEKEIQVKKEVAPTAKRETLADTVEYTITGTRTTYTIRSGESLVRVAFKFYGNKKLWPYLVKHNKDIIRNANVVPVGTTIRIPELSPKAETRQ